MGKKSNGNTGETAPKPKQPVMAIPIPESFFSNNRPMSVMEVDGVDVSVTMLASGKAEAWSVDNTEVERLDNLLDVLNKSAHALKTKAMKAADDGEIIDEAMAAWKVVFDRVCTVAAERFQVIRNQLIAYDPEVFTAELLQRAGAGQIQAAWSFLRQYNDPLLVTNTLQLEIARQIRASTSSPLMRS